MGRRPSLLAKPRPATCTWPSHCKLTIYQRKVPEQPDLLDDSAQVLVLGVNHELQMRDLLLEQGDLLLQILATGKAKGKRE